ncbi:MAG: TetR family transcriptional regulator [Acidimicrobiia bacterium]
MSTSPASARGRAPGRGRVAYEPQQERSQLSTQRLLDATAELIAERGYTDTTLVAIGQRAGFSRGLVNARFGSKEALVWTFVERASEPWSPEVFGEIDDRSGLDRVLAATEAVAANAVEEPTVLRAFIRLIIDSAQSIPSLSQRFQRSFAALQRHLTAFFRQGVEDGSIRPDIDPQAEADLLLAAWRGISIQWVVYPDRTDLRKLYDTLLDKLRRDLVPPA